MVNRSGLCVLAALTAATSARAQAAPQVAVPPVASPPSTASPTAPPPEPPLPTRAVVFHPDRAEAQLQFYGIWFAHGTWNEGWFPACAGPCAQYVPLSGRYRVGGPGIDGSRTFAIGPGNRPLYLEAKTGSASAESLGTLAAIFGGIFLVGGLLTAGMADMCGLSEEHGACDNRATTQAIALTFAGVGVAGLVGGILAATKNQTTVWGDEPPPEAR